MRAALLLSVFTTLAFVGCLQGLGYGEDGAPGSAGRPDDCPLLNDEGCGECPWVDGCQVPPVDPDADVAFLLEEEYEHGDEVEVRIRNDGDRSYVYGTYYESCAIGYYTDQGRKFLVPEGTHCDIANSAELAPGQTVTLFRWNLDECVDDQWGCAESKPLPRGTYHLRDALHYLAESGGDYPMGGEKGPTFGATIRIA